MITNNKVKNFCIKFQVKYDDEFIYAMKRMIGVGVLSTGSSFCDSEI